MIPEPWRLGIPLKWVFVGWIVLGVAIAIGGLGSASGVLLATLPGLLLAYVGWQMLHGRSILPVGVQRTFARRSVAAHRERPLAQPSKPVGSGRDASAPRTPAPADVDQLFDTVSAFGEAMTACEGMIEKPESKLPATKRAIKEAVIRLHHLLATVEGRRLIETRYAPAFANHVLSAPYRSRLESALVHLADFVADDEAALCHWFNVAIQKAAKSGRVMTEEQPTTEQTQRVIAIQARCSAEARGYLDEMQERSLS